MGLLVGEQETKAFWEAAYQAAELKEPIIGGAYTPGFAPSPATPAPMATRKAINLPSAALSEGQLARLEAAMLGTEPAPVAAPVVEVSFTLNAVQDLAAMHLATLQAARAPLRTGTEASYQTSVQQLRTAQAAARQFYGDVLSHIEHDQPAEAPELCAALNALDLTCAALDQAVL